GQISCVLRLGGFCCAHDSVWFPQRRRSQGADGLGARCVFALPGDAAIEGLTSFDVGGSASYLTAKQEDDLKAWVGAALPRSTRQIGAWIETEFGLVYESRSGLVALLHRLGLEYHKPDVIPRKLDVEKQKAFIESYDNLLNSLPDNEAVLFVDAVHSTHAARPVGCR